MAKTDKHLVIVLDGIDRLKGNRNNKPGDVQINWLAAKLQPRVHIILSFSTNNQNSELTQQFLGKFVFAESLVQVAPMTDEDLKKTIRSRLALENRQITDYQERCVRSALRGKARPLLVDCVCEDAARWDSRYVIAYAGDTSTLMSSCEQAIGRRFSVVERRYTLELVGYIARYLSSACTGLSEMELLDLLSCNKEAMVAAGSKLWRGPVCRFPFSLWLRIRLDLGVLLEERFIDCKSLICWSNHLIWQTTVTRYFIQVDQIKQTHKDIAELFLLTTSMGTIEQSDNRTACSEWRPICPQPLLYSETKYNLRRLSELWYQLLHAGEIDRFKEHCFCHFDYLLAKMHSSSVTSLICALEKTLSHVLDAELHIILRCIVQAKQILLRDPLQLASELIGRLRQVKEQYPCHIDNLVLQCMEWCDAHSLPLLVPLSSWLPDPRTPLVSTLECRDDVGRLAVTRNGQHLFCTTARNEIVMYHVPSKKMIRSFTGHESALTSLCLTRSNRFIISAGTDCCIKIYEINTGQLIRTLRHHTDSVLCLLVTKSDEFIISGSQDCQFAVCLLETGKIKHMYKEHTAGITCMCLNQKNTVLVTASSDKTIKSWTFDDLILLNVIEDGIESPIATLALSIDNTFLVIGLFDNSLIVKSFTTGSDVHRLEGHKGRVTDVLISKDCHHCVIACTDGCLYTYNLRTTELLDMSSCRNPVTSVCLSKDENFIFSASKDTVKVWTFYRRQTRLNHSDDHTDHVTCISISEDGKTAITGSKDTMVKLWNLDISDFMENLVGHTDVITCVALDKEDQFAASGSADNSVKIWSIMMGCVITNFKEHKSTINGLIVVQSGRVLSSESDGVIKLWKAENGEVLITLFGPVVLLGVSPNAELALSGIGNQSLKLWSMATGDIYQTINHADKITTAMFSKDSQYLVTGSVDQSLKIWEAINGRLAQVLVEHTDTVSCVAITTNNRHVVSGSYDKTLLVWGLAAGAVEHRLDGHTDQVTCVKVTEDGTIALSGSRDGCIHMWNLVYGLPVTIFDMHLAVLSVEMTNDGGHVVVRLEHGCHVPLMCLHNTPAGEVKSQSQVEIQVIGGGPVLPIRKKALVVNRPATNMMLAKVNKTGAIFRSVSSIPEIVKAPLQKAVRAQEQNKQSRLQRLMNRKKGKEPSSASKTRKQEKKSGICTLL